MLRRAVIAAFMGGLSGIVMLYVLGMVGSLLLSCTLDKAAKTYTCGPQELSTPHLALYGLGLCWALSTPGFAAFGIAGVRPAWIAQVAAMGTVALSFVVLFGGYDIATTLRFDDPNLIVFAAIWLVVPPALGLIVSVMAESDERPEPFTGFETYSTSINSR